MAAIEETPEYVGAFLRLCLQARFHGREKEQVEAPLPCEDGKTYSLRIWCTDGTDYSTSFTVRNPAAITATE